MKTFEEINEQYIHLQAEFARTTEEKYRRALESEWRKLKPIWLILRTNPREEKILKQLAEEERKLNILESRYSEWRVGKKNNSRKEYEREMGLKDIRKKIKILKKIINN